MSPTVVQNIAARFHRGSSQSGGGGGGDKDTLAAREEEKQRLAAWEAEKRPLEIAEITVDPEKKPVGHSSKVLTRDDFDLITTLGTGTFARVWLAKLRQSAPPHRHRSLHLRRSSRTPSNAVAAGHGGGGGAGEEHGADNGGENGETNHKAAHEDGPAGGERSESAEPGSDTRKVFALKILRKTEVIRLKQVEHVRNERAVLAAVAGHPFITTLVASFQDRDCLYMLLDYCPGGEVFSYLRRARRFNEPTAQFYAAEIVLILQFLHEQQGVAYRDLKPENILIDAEGHLKLVDFGFAKKIDNRETYTLCGTPEYLAPEVIRNTGHGTAVDWWAFGILIYEFLVGQPPFWDQNPLKIYEQIVEGRVRYPSAMGADARDLIAGLCTVDVTKRLGHVRGGAAAVRRHPWFRHIDWDALYHRRTPGPIVPHLRAPDDSRNFDEYDAEPVHRDQYTKELADKYDHHFVDF